jgi:DNA-binding SARP family transcriptional activator
VGLYAGDVLTGFSDDWALREREKHRRLQLNALGRLMQISSLARDAAGGIRYAQAILDLDALREDVHRELMRFYLLAGQRAMALRQYETCRAALKAELAIHPMRETVEMYRRIADSAVGVTPEPMPESATAFVSIAALSGAASLDPAELIASARRHIAAADSQLQLTLPFVLPPKPGH